MTKREFHFTEGTSQKFWRIEHEGATTTVEFGKIGTAGQAQTKDYADEATAQAAYQKLIAEKVKKGYQEVGASAATPTPVAAKPVASKPATVASAPAATVAQPQAEPQPVVAPLDEPARIDLDPIDWFWAPWRNTPALERPAETPFNQADALKRLSKVGRDQYFYSWNWDRAAMPITPSREEAQFWLTAMQVPQKRQKPQELAAELAQQTFDGNWTATDALQKLEVGNHSHLTAIAMVSAFCTPAEFARWLIHLPNASGNAAYYISHGVGTLLAGFRQFILPYLSLEERQQLSALVAPELAKVPLQAQQNYYAGFPSAVYFAAMFGGHSNFLDKLISSWPDDHYTGESWNDHYQRPQDVLFGLSDPQLVIHHARRLKLQFHRPELVRGWLAHTEFAALDVLRDSALAQTNREEATAEIEALSVAVGPQVAPVMLELMHASRAPQLARAWLDTHPGPTIAGLLPVAAGKSKIAPQAADLLRRFFRRGYGEAIETALATLSSDEADKIRATVIDIAVDNRPVLDEANAPQTLRDGFADQRSKKKNDIPAWVGADELPPLVVNGQVLDEAQRALVLASLQQSKLGAPLKLVAAVREHVEPASRATFVWALFEQWLANGAVSKENWAMSALGQLGDDSTALRLGPLIRVWPGESQHQRAINGLECLRAIGSDTALMQINGIAQKVKFKALQNGAMQRMDEIAKDRGLSRDELEDRIVPDCELDERGERIFDFGSRQFRFVLGGELKPMIRDETGKLKTDLPKPNSKDDAEKAAQAIADWKLLKKQVAEAAKVQAQRLEQAMITGRHWPRETFELLIVRHPLMTHLARPLIWGAYNNNGTLATFRVTEDQSYADSSDDTFDLTPFANVGIVHPLHMSAPDQSAWGEVLSDYELIPPFAQLGRPVYQLEGDERDKNIITRFNKRKIAAASLVFGLDKYGWQRDAPADGGGFSGHFKPFHQANVTAVVQYQEGVGVGYIIDAPDQQIEYVVFVPGIRKQEWWPEHKDRLPLASVDSVVVSETLSDLTAIMAKATS